MVELLSRVDPNKYQTFMLEEKGKMVLYVKLQKALYGMLQAALLFWEHQTKFLTEELGFTVNPYDRCIINKMIKGKQCTIIWYVDHLKLSHSTRGHRQEAQCKVWSEGSTYHPPRSSTRIPWNDNQLL
jgi:hypothetical protein